MLLLDQKAQTHATQRTHLNIFTKKKKKMMRKSKKRDFPEARRFCRSLLKTTKLRTLWRARKKFASFMRASARSPIFTRRRDAPTAEAVILRPPNPPAAKYLLTAATPRVPTPLYLISANLCLRCFLGKCNCFVNVNCPCR